MSVRVYRMRKRQTYVLEVDDGISDHVWNTSVTDNILKIHSYCHLHKDGATQKTCARSRCDVVVGGGKLADLGRRHGRRTCPWRWQLWGPLFMLGGER
jgi:hypothetical protein